MQIDFENGEILVRHYDNKNKLFINHIAPLILPDKKYKTIILDEMFEKDVMELPQKKMEFEYEYMNYLPIKIRDNREKDGRYYYPLIRIIAERKSELLINNSIIDKNDYENINEYILESVRILTDYIFKYGRPSIIYVRDEETKMILKNFAKKAKIKIGIRAKLKVIDDFYDELDEDNMLG